MIDRDTPFMARLPVDPPIVITTRFGEPSDPIAGGHPHRGTDFAKPVGSSLYAPARGKVLNHPLGGGWGDGSFGNFIAIDHPDTPWYTGYAHLSALLVPDGRLVEAGELIGLTGNSGLSTGPHLHWQMSTTPYFGSNMADTADPMLYLLPEDDMTLITELEAALAQAKADIQTTNDACAIREAIHRMAADMSDDGYARVLRAHAALREAGVLP